MYLRYFNDGGETDAQQSFADMYKELSTPDKQRLWAVVGDIAALVDPEPISSVGMGLASDYLNAKADIADNGWSWKTAKNLATNVGLTALSAIPVAGQVLGSSAKAVRTLLKLTPWLTKAATVAAAAGIITNGPEMVRSLENLSKGDYTIDDIRNAGMMLQTILGGANALRRKSKALSSTRNGINERINREIAAESAWNQFNEQKQILDNIKGGNDAALIINGRGPNTTHEIKIPGLIDTPVKLVRGQESYVDVRLPIKEEYSKFLPSDLRLSPPFRLSTNWRNRRRVLNQWLEPEDNVPITYSYGPSEYDISIYERNLYDFIRKNRLQKQLLYPLRNMLRSFWPKPL